MKFPHIILFLVYLSARYAFGAEFIPPVASVSDDAMLAAIADVETGNNAAKRGHHGERSQLQIMPATWREFSRLPHSVAATNPEETDRVAHAYLAVIRARLRARGLPETPFFIAAGWNAGAGWKRLHRSTVAYAERVTNVVEASQPRSEITATIAPPALAPIILTPAPAVASVQLSREVQSPTRVAFARPDSIPVIGIATVN